MRYDCCMVARASHKEPTAGAAVNRRGAKRVADTSGARATSPYWNERVAMLMCGRCDTSLTLANFEAGQCQCGAKLPRIKLPVDTNTNTMRAKLAALLGA
jgi:hypothetical protein